MATYTPYLNLYKPSRLDTTVEVDTSLTSNFELIDTAFKDLSDQTNLSTYAKLSGAVFSGQIKVPSIRLVDAIYSDKTMSYIFRDHKNGNTSVSASGGDLYLGYTYTNGIRTEAPFKGQVQVTESTIPLKWTPKNSDGTYANQIYFTSAKNEGISSNQYENALILDTASDRVFHIAGKGIGRAYVNVDGGISVQGQDVYHDGRINYGTSSSPSGGSSGDIYIQI